MPVSPADLAPKVAPRFCFHNRVSQSQISHSFHHESFVQSAFICYMISQGLNSLVLVNISHGALADARCSFSVVG